MDAGRDRNATKGRQQGKEIETISQPEFLHRATKVGNHIRYHLQQIQAKHPDMIGDVRGLGAMLAMEVVEDAASKRPSMNETARITQETMKRGLITIRAGLYSNCVRFLPPLNVSDDEIDENFLVEVKDL